MNHELDRCRIYASKPYTDKVQLIKTRGLCFGCLKKASHLVKDCNRKLTCDKCQLKHPTVLHREKPFVETEAKTVQTLVGMIDADCHAMGHKDLAGKPIIIPVKLRCKATGISIETYAFIDNGSDTVFCTERISQQLNISGPKTKLNMRTINGNKITDTHMLRGLEVSDLDGHNTIGLPVTYTQKEIPVSKKDILSQADILNWSYLRDVRLPSIEAGIDLLIGNNVPKAFEPWEVVNSQGDGPFAVRTVLGWAVNGFLTGAGETKDEMFITAKVNRIQAKPSFDSQLVEFFNHEFSERVIDDKPEDSVEDKKFMKMMETECHLVKGHYQLPLPFRDRNHVVPNNRPAIEQRLKHLKRRFVKDPEYQEEYTQFMDGILDKGYAELVPAEQLSSRKGKIWYLPHHGVRHPQKKRLRVVFDCAAEFRGTSLNEMLMQGPDLTNSLVGVLTWFRQEPVALMSDIQAMFSQVTVPIEGRDYQRYLWWPNEDINETPQEYRMKVHIFGATSSPSCANYALRRTAADNRSITGVCAANATEKNFYVDDLLKSVSTVKDGKTLASNLIETCSREGFRLTKWISNECSVLESIPLD
uniref:Uncharacterized protein LOC102802724 n=1 Tax=Saccoglossus kowalevskii TaxID=10224 RepID=A0ABM0LUE0_SACKO|nr:PREDICTED: uncharacterized protein LOC102802724 [Saccoglossus kowalevskii]